MAVCRHPSGGRRRTDGAWIISEKRMSMKISTAVSRLLLALLAALIGIAVYLYTDHYTSRYFERKQQTAQALQQLQNEIQIIESEILKRRSGLYRETGTLNTHLQRFNSLLTRLYDTPFLLGPFYRDTYRELTGLARDFESFRERVKNFLTLNSTLREKIARLPRLQREAFSLFDTGPTESRKVLQPVSEAIAAFTLAFSAPQAHSRNLQQQLQDLDTLSRNFHDPARQAFLQSLRERLSDLNHLYALYSSQMKALLQNPLHERIAHLQATFQKDAQAELQDINDTNRLLLALYLVSLTVIIYYIVKTQEENKRLEELKNHLEHLLVTDSLTGLGNRYAFTRDEKKLYNPALILLNIDRFKHINEFYGTHIGDRVLQEVAEELRTVTPPNLNARLYRLGGDDFGVLFENRVGEWELENLVLFFYETLESHTITVDDLEIDLSYALGASSEIGRLFECADMALSAAKDSVNSPWLVYDSSIDKRPEIARNITSIRRLRNALAEENLLPYYQPIVSLKNPSKLKYEALARIEITESGKVIEPGSFMRMAREAKLSGRITQEILEKTFSIAGKNPGNFFSINLSTEDIEDTEIRRSIIRMIAEHAEIASQIVIEILESEEVGDYTILSEFIAAIKRHGCRIAIDDFGSGYSNFEKILKLDIDMIKIDGSLISRIDHDKHSELIVKTILDFAQYAGIETVAEYVHSKAIYDKVLELGFDYAQGFYLGEPSRSLGIVPALPPAS